MRILIFRRRCVLVSALFLVSVLTAGVVEASSILATSELQGQRTTGGGGLVANGNQAGNGFMLKWDITFNNVTKLYHYKYEIFDEAGNNEIETSHFNLEVSSFFTSADLSNPTVTPVVGPQTLEVAQGNEGMPSAMAWAVKFDGEDDTYEFDSPKVPVYSDVFGKKGDGGFYNAGFGTDPTAGDSPFTNWIAAPDTDTGGTAIIPLPAALWMGLVLIGGMGAGMYRRRLR